MRPLGVRGAAATPRPRRRPDGGKGGGVKAFDSYARRAFLKPGSEEYIQAMDAWDSAILAAQEQVPLTRANIEITGPIQSALSALQSWAVAPKHQALSTKQ